MSVYTMEFRAFFDAGFKIGDYPIWDEAYRNVLNNKIKSHYYFREIGQETPNRFKFYLDTKLNEIMPYYNELYKTTLLKYDIDVISSTNETYTGSADGKAAATTENSADSSSKSTATAKTSSETSSESADTSSSKTTAENATESSSTSSSSTKNTGTIENKSEYDSDNTTTSNDVYSLSDNRELDTPEGALTLVDGQLSAGYLTKATTNRTEQGGSTIAEHTGTDTTTTTNNTLSATDGSASSVAEANSSTATSSTVSGTASGTTSSDASNVATTSNATESSSSSTSSSKSTNEYFKSIVVKNPNLAVNSIAKLRENILNIDMMIISELDELFMQIY